MPAHRNRSQAKVATARAGELSVTVAVLAGLAAAWVAAGSTGLLVHPLRKAVALALLVVVVVSHFPSRCRARSCLLALAAAAVVVMMVVSPMPVVNIAASTLVLGLLALLSAGADRSMLLSATVASLALVVYRLVYTTIPIAWSMAEIAGSGVGKLAGILSGRPLSVGPTFAGLDLLLLTLAFWIVWMARTAHRRMMPALFGLAAIIAGHLSYLVVLSYVPTFLRELPPIPDEAGWSWVGLIHKAVPWNLPILGAVIHLVIVTAMLRWSSWQVRPAVGSVSHSGSASRRRWGFAAAALGIAGLLPAVTALHVTRPNLNDKKIVFYEKGFLNWLKPAHGNYGRLSSGMYGMLPVYLESLGAQTLVSSDLSPEDLEGADAVVLIFPDEPWSPGQLDRLWSFVRAGGSLLVLGEHTTVDPNGSNRFNEALKPTNMRVAFDSATFAVGGWLHSYEAMLHPMTAGVPDDRNQIGIVIGASLIGGLASRPIVIGRWGWADDGDVGSSRAMMGNDVYDAGERLGDLLLAAEQPIGRGKIVAFGDTSSLTNGINVGAHVFTSRLFAYLADGTFRAHTVWRQALSVLLVVALAVVLMRCTTPETVLLAAFGLVASLSLTATLTHRTWELLPDGRRQAPNNLAYVDASHLPAYSGESWRSEGVGGLMLTLMRNDLLALSLPKLDRERLQRAGLLFVIAPRRSYSKVERQAVREFVEGGGCLVVTVGYDDAGPVRSLLADYGFAIGEGINDDREPVPMGHFKSPYLRSGDRQVYVRFHAAWPVACSGPNARIIAYGRNDSPVIVLRRVGAGKVVVIGDTLFAANVNLEREDGRAFEGLRENADFWRWFLPVLRDQPAWVPPALEVPEGRMHGAAGTEEETP